MSTGKIKQELESTKPLTVSDLTVSASGVVILNLPTSDPAVAGQLWSSSGTVTVSAG